MNNLKAQNFGLGVNMIIKIVIGLIIVLIAVWFGGKVLGLGDIVGSSLG